MFKKYYNIFILDFSIIRDIPRFKIILTLVEFFIDIKQTIKKHT